MEGSWANSLYFQEVLPLGTISDINDDNGNIAANT